MLAIFKKGIVNPPQELNSPASSSSSSSDKPDKLPQEILRHFASSVSSNAFSITFGDSASFAYVPPTSPLAFHQRLFCGLDDIYCIFLGSLNNLSSLIRQYGLSKGTNDAMFVIESYKTLRDRGPYPAHQVLKDLDGTFGFVVYDTKSDHVFAALGAKEGVGLYWGIAGDGSVVISDNLEVIKRGCGKSFAAFPSGCMFHSAQGLTSFEHPTSIMKAIPRIDSEGAMCGADFKVDNKSRTGGIPRVGSEANWALGSSRSLT